LFRLHPELEKRYCDGSLWSSGKFFRSVGNVTAETIKHYIKNLRGNQKHRFNRADQEDLVNEESMISGFHKSECEGVRPEAYPLL
jgi:REP element-mobilizing transposase RayT